MGYATAAMCLAAAAAAVCGSPASTQPPTNTPSASFTAERDAGNAALLWAEKLLSAGQRGPESETCALMNSVLLHYVNAADAAGARTRLLDWSELTPVEKESVMEKINGLFERNSRMRSYACRSS
jgi:hypothetical protein